jgi:hypothetical protein
VYQNRQVVSRRCPFKLSRLVERFENFARLAFAQAGVISQKRPSGLLRWREAVISGSPDAIRLHGHHPSISNRSKAESAAMMNPAISIAIKTNSIAVAFSRLITLRGDET